MPKHQLTELSVEEISLVDRPSNPGAWIALRKRDGQGEKRMSKLKKILKSETVCTRDEFVEAVKKEAQRIGKRESEMWEDPVLHAYYEGLPKETALPTVLRKSALDAAEMLQSAFLRIRKSSPGLSTNECYDKALEALEPSTRGQYLAEILKARRTPDVEEEEEENDEDGDEQNEDGEDQDDDTGHHQIQDRESTGRYKRKRKASDEDGLTRICGKADDAACPACGSDSVAPGDKYCAQCGAELSKRAKRQTTA